MVEMSTCKRNDMTSMDTPLKEQLKHLHVDFDHIREESTREEVSLLLNGVEQLSNENDQLKEKVQRLTDEINRLKGEQGKPKIRAGKKDTDISSEQERKEDKSSEQKKSKAKQHLINADREILCPLDLSALPSDVVFKGYDCVTIQDIVIKTDNIEFKREVYYSPSLGQRFIASLPGGYHGEFGPGVKSLVLSLSHDGVMSQPAIHRFLETSGIHLSKATLSRIITDGCAIFHQEKAAILSAGLQSSVYQHIDDTGARVNGKNHYTHVLCNPFYTAYFTRPKKDRLTILELLSGGALVFHLNQDAFELMLDLGLSDKQQARIRPLLNDEPMSRADMDQCLKTLFPNPKKHAGNRRLILEASALVAYQHREDLIKILVCDDAPQFKNITESLALCWVHEGRHYKKLNPFLDIHQAQVDAVLSDLWAFYRELLAYKEAPCEAKAKTLSEQFDAIFSQTTGYDLLDDRLQKTLAKKDHLLLVLTYPQIPLNNNDAELGARVQTRKGDVSLQTKNEKGTQAKDTMMTIVQTARKLGVNVFDYIYDRISSTFKMPSLASLIALRSQSPVPCDTS